MSKIKVLDTLTANKIAAGEVVERPASVVKELVENAIDAGSTKIEVLIEKGGLNKITVIDNGEGMDKEDAGLAFERHATSKIRDDRDLDAISSLGFRGEALPSISAVARVELKTRPHQAISGTHIVLENGKVLFENEAGCPAGTCITVNNLFGNTPARLKNVKSPSLESGHISDVVNRLAVAYPEISFMLKHEKRLLINTSGTGDLLSIIASLYGTELARDLLPVNISEEGIEITGYISKPSLTRSSRNQQAFIINRRTVRNRILSQALEDGYHSMLMKGRHPIGFININLSPALVDPNVHPAKTEVRLSIIDKIRELLYNVVKQILSRNNLVPDTSFNQHKQSSHSVPIKEEYLQQALDMKSKKENSSSPKKNPSILTESKELTKEDAFGKDLNNQDVFNHKFNKVDVIDKKLTKEDNFEEFSTISNTFEKCLDNKVGYKPNIEDEEHCKVVEEEEEVYDKVEESDKENLPELRALGQIDNTYIVAQGNGGLYLIDQHAAHERVLYEKNMSGNREQYTQLLAVPQNLELVHMEAQILIKYIVDFHELGFIIEHFGGDSFLLRGVPKGFPGGTEKKIFMDILDYFFQNQHKLTNKELREAIIIQMSCKAAIKAGDRLTPGQIETLIDNLKKTELPFTCPHGRPTVIHITQYELEKMFKRVL